MHNIKKNIFWSSIEYHYSDKSSDFKKLDGGFVYVFIKSFDVREALDLILESLDKQNLVPFNIEFISPYDKEIDWESIDQSNHYLELYNVANNSSDVIYDDFYAYEKKVCDD